VAEKVKVQRRVCHVRQDIRVSVQAQGLGTYVFFFPRPKHSVPLVGVHDVGDPPLSYYNDDFGGQLPADFRPMRFVPIAHPNSSLAVASARMVEFYIACNLTVAFFDHQGFGTDRSTAFVLLGYVGNKINKNYNYVMSYVRD